MDYNPKMSQAKALEFSSIIESAPYIVESNSRVDRGYTAMYSLKCRSCQSQNCPRTPMPGKLENKSQKE